MIDLYFVYVIENTISGSYYVGFTNNPKGRWGSHLHSSRVGVKTKLYDNMRKYGEDCFEMSILRSFQTKEEALSFETDQIDLSDAKCLNLSPGGEGGFVVQDKEDWKSKLSKARKGKKPSLGMSHTEENKKFFSEVSREYWDGQETYNASEIVQYSFKEAKKLFGISKTHYYRLLKRAKSNDLG